MMVSFDENHFTGFGMIIYGQGVNVATFFYRDMIVIQSIPVDGMISGFLYS